MKIEDTYIDNVIRDFKHFKHIREFYNQKFTTNPCFTLYHAVKASEDEEIKEKLKMCNKDKLITMVNNSESLSAIISNNIYTLEKKKKLLDKGRLIVNNKALNSTLFVTDEFKEVEYIYYNYIEGIAQRINEVVNVSLNDFLKEMRIQIITILTVFSFVVFVFSIFIWFFYTKKLINFIRISRCTMKIIPSKVISKTLEIENWIDNNLY